MAVSTANETKPLLAIHFAERAFSAIAFEQALAWAVGMCGSLPDHRAHGIATLDTAAQRLQQAVDSAEKDIHSTTTGHDHRSGQAQLDISSHVSSRLDDLKRYAEDAKRCCEALRGYGKVQEQLDACASEVAECLADPEAATYASRLEALKPRVLAFLNGTETHQALRAEQGKGNHWLIGQDHLIDDLVRHQKIASIVSNGDIDTGLIYSHDRDCNDLLDDSLAELDLTSSALGKEAASELLEQYETQSGIIHGLREGLKDGLADLLDHYQALPQEHPKEVQDRRWFNGQLRAASLGASCLSLKMIDILCSAGTRVDELKIEAARIWTAVRSFGDSLDEFFRGPDARGEYLQDYLAEAEVLRHAARTGVDLHDDLVELSETVKTMAKDHPFKDKVLSLIKSAKSDLAFVNLITEEEAADRSLRCGDADDTMRKEAAEEARRMLHEKYEGLQRHWTPKELKEMTLSQRGAQGPASPVRTKGEAEGTSSTSGAAALSASVKPSWMETAAIFNDAFVKNRGNDASHSLTAARSRADMPLNNVKGPVDDLRSEEWIDEQMSEAIGIVKRRMADLSGHRKQVSEAIQKAGESPSKDSAGSTALKTLRHADTKLQASFKSLKDALEKLEQVQVVLKHARLVRLFFCPDKPKDSILRRLIDAGIFVSAREHQGSRIKDGNGYFEYDRIRMRLSKAVRRAMGEEVLPTDPEEKVITLQCHTHYKRETGGKPCAQHFKLENMIDMPKLQADQQRQLVFRGAISRRPRAFEQTLVTLRQFAATGTY